MGTDSDPGWLAATCSSVLLSASKVRITDPLPYPAGPENPGDDLSPLPPSSMAMDARRPWCRITAVEADGSSRSWTLDGTGAPDLETVDRLARLLLAAARDGRRLVVDRVDPRLEELIDLVGLSVEVQR